MDVPQLEPVTVVEDARHPTPPALNISIVAAKGEHLPFILNSWIRSYTSKGEWRGCPAHHLARAQHALCREILSRPSTVVLVAEPFGGGHGQVCGYVVGEPDESVMHWCYVKSAFRGARVATRLLGKAFGPRDTDAGGIIYCSHWCGLASKLASKWNLLYRPQGLG